MSYTSPTPEDIAARRAHLAAFDRTNERVWLALYAAILAWLPDPPRSYLDLGSGTGAMVNMARKIGIDAWGVDVINGPEHWFLHHDLNTPLRLSYDRDTERMHANSLVGRERRFPLVTCLEVAEHLEDGAADVLCDTIARHVAPGGILVFSAAPPGQGGEHHTNCLPAYRWRSLLHERKVSYREDYTRQLSHLWDLVSGPASAWLCANVQVFDTWNGTDA